MATENHTSARAGTDELIREARAHRGMLLQAADAADRFPLKAQLTAAAGLLGKLDQRLSAEAGPDAGTPGIPKALADRIQELRVRLFLPMNIVGTARLAIDHEADIDLHYTLKHAYTLLDKVAEDLDYISGDVAELEGETYMDVVRRMGSAQEAAGGAQ